MTKPVWTQEELKNKIAENLDMWIGIYFNSSNERKIKRWVNF
jgi:hypothetical protein